jgi:WD40 repeat protein
MGCPVRATRIAFLLMLTRWYRQDRTAAPQRNYAHSAPVNDLALHSNQGELISCDQSGAIKIWDLGGDCCSHELVRAFVASVT